MTIIVFEHKTPVCLTLCVCLYVNTSGVFDTQFHKIYYNFLVSWDGVRLGPHITSASISSIASAPGG
jgi:hypothetical protein